jgi:hypothetical protein
MPTRCSDRAPADHDLAMRLLQVDRSCYESYWLEEPNAATGRHDRSKCYDRSVVPSPSLGPLGLSPASGVGDCPNDQNQSRNTTVVDLHFVSPARTVVCYVFSTSFLLGLMWAGGQAYRLPPVIWYWNT